MVARFFKMKTLFSNPWFSGFVFLVILGTVSCEGINLSGVDDAGVDGTWKLDGNGVFTTYLSISSDSLNFYNYHTVRECVTPAKYKLNRVEDGGFYFLEEAKSGKEMVLAISENENKLHVRDIEKTQEELDVYDRAAITADSLQIGCSDKASNNGNDNGNNEEVYGDWETTQGNVKKLFIRLTEDKLTKITFNEAGSCFISSSSDILERIGDVFTISSPDGETDETQELIISRQGNNIEIEEVISGVAEVQRFKSSNEDFDLFTPVCEGSAGIPDSGVLKLLGNWETLQGNVAKTYLSISTDSLLIKTFEEETSCYITRQFYVEEVDSDLFTLIDQSTEESVELEIKKQGNNISVSDGNSTQRFTSSEEDVINLNPECEGETEPGPEGESIINEVQGAWETSQGNKEQEFVFISSDSIKTVQFNKESECYLVTSVFEIVSADKERVNLLDSKGSQIHVDIIQRGKQLEIVSDPDGNKVRKRYKSSEKKISDLTPVCGSEVITDPEPNEEGDFSGGWETMQGNVAKEFVFITNSTVSFVSEGASSNCFVYTGTQILSSNEDTFELEYNNGETEEITIKKQGKNIEISRKVGGEVKKTKYKPSNVKPGELTPECNNETEPEPNSDPVKNIDISGKWETAQGNVAKQYMEVSDSEINLLKEDETGSCFVSDHFSIINVDGASFTIEDDEELQTVFTVEMQGKNITLQFEGDASSIKFKSSNKDLSSLSPDCNDIPEEDPQPEPEPLEDYTGTWETAQGNMAKIYVQVSDTEIAIVRESEEVSCFTSELFEITGRTGDVFDVLDQDGSTGTIIFTKQGNNISVQFSGESSGIKFKSSNKNLSSLSPDCNDIPEEDPQPEPEPLEDYTGTWETAQGNMAKIYVQVSDTEIAIVRESEEVSCFTSELFEITGRTGDVFDVLDQDGSTGTIIFTKQGNNISVQFSGESSSIKFKSSNKDLSSLSPDCGDIPVEVIGKPDVIEPEENIDITGKWETAQGNKAKVYVEVDEVELKMIEEDEGLSCFTASIFSIREINGAVITLTDEWGQDVNATVETQGNSITLLFENSIDPIKLKSSNLDFTNLSPDCSAIEDEIPDTEDPVVIDAAGNWEFSQGKKPKLYISITESSIQWITESDECYITENFEVISIDNDVFELMDVDSQTWTFLITLKGNTLEVEREIEGSPVTTKFKSSDTTFANLIPECTNSIQKRI